jgi:sarcosine oxidase subunit beta
LDAGQPGQQSTGRATGGIRRQFGSAIEIRLTEASLDFYAPIFSDADFAGRFERDGYLFLAEHEQRERLEAALRLQQSHGVPSEWLDPAALRARFPFVDLSNIVGATWCEEDGFIDPWSIVQWLLGRCRALGVVIRSQRQVHEIDVGHGRVRAVRSGDERVHAPIVVNAAGAWAGAVAALAGVRLPVRASPRMQIVTDATHGLPATTPLVVDLSTGAYVRGMAGRVLAGVSPAKERFGFELEPTAEEVEAIAACISFRFPGLLNAGVARIITGLYEVTPDGLPIASAGEHIEGFCTVAGFNGHGIMHGPALSCAMADMILYGRSTRFDITPFSAHRFDAGPLAHDRSSSLI